MRALEKVRRVTFPGGCYLTAAVAIPLCLAAGRVARSEQPEAGTRSGYVGAEACIECHRERYQQVSQSRHWKTWRPAKALDDYPHLPQQTRVEEIDYGVEKVDGQWRYWIRLPGGPRQQFRIHSVVGGDRLGLGLILSIEEIEDRRLPVEALVEARYMLGVQEPVFRLAPGFPQEKPHDYADAIGHVLSPEFAERCLGCHGGPRDTGLARAGGPHPVFGDVAVTCERCHGPAAGHVEAARAEAKDVKIVHPGKLENAKLNRICAECHDSFFPVAQPRPEDLLVASQVAALENSECFIQSGGGLSCLSCHNPHENARPRSRAYGFICADCHSPQQAGSVLCPVEPRGDCIACHMPEAVIPEDFHVTDHWIRVIR